MGKKLLRDCKDNKAELGSIAILVFLALFVFSGLLSASKGMAYEFDKWSSETNLADAWVTPRSQKKIVGQDASCQCRHRRCRWTICLRY